MAPAPQPCECFGQMPLPERPGCLHCGKPTPPGKWRCPSCQRDREAQAVLESAGRVVNAAAAIMRDERRAESARVHDDAPPPA